MGCICTSIETHMRFVWNAYALFSATAWLKRGLRKDSLAPRGSELGQYRY